jgi:hypothetical protein
MKPKYLFLTLALLSFLAFNVSGSFAESADDYYHSGLTDYQAGKWEEAVSYLVGAVQQNPNYWQAYQLLAYSYYHLNDIPKCIQNGEASLQINATNPTLQTFVDKLKTQNMSAPSVDAPENNSAVASPIEAPSLPLLNSDAKIHNSFYFNLAAVSPYAPSDFANGWTSGGSLGLAYGFGLNKMTSIVLSGQYSTFPYGQTYPGVTLSGGAFHTLTFLVNGKFLLVGAGNPVDFYLITGVGPTEFISDALTGTDNFTGQTATETATQLSELDFALRFGLGIDIRIGNNMFLYLESNGVDTFVSQKVSDQPLTNNQFSFGMKFDN